MTATNMCSNFVGFRSSATVNLIKTNLAIMLLVVSYPMPYMYETGQVMCPSICIEFYSRSQNILK